MIYLFTPQVLEQEMTRSVAKYREENRLTKQFWDWVQVFVQMSTKDICPNINRDKHFRISHLKTLAALLPMLWCDRRPWLESLGEGWSNS